MKAVWIQIGMPIRLVWSVCFTCLAIPTYVVLILLLRPLLYVSPAFFWIIEKHLTRWMHGFTGAFLKMAGYTVAETGDDLSECLDDECLLLINHQSTADVPVLQYASQNKGPAAQGVVWVPSNVYKYTPFGLLSLVRDDPFIAEVSKSDRQSEIEKLTKHMQTVFMNIPVKKWIYLFPEGGFLRKRRARGQEYARKNGFPVLEHVTLPRIGATRAILDALSPNSTLYRNGVQPKRSLKWVIDVAIGYPGNRTMDILSIITCKPPPSQIVLHYKVFPAKEVPVDTEELTTWLYDRAVEKDRLLAEFYSSGIFPFGLSNAPASFGHAAGQEHKTESKANVACNDISNQEDVTNQDNTSRNIPTENQIKPEKEKSIMARVPKEVPLGVVRIVLTKLLILTIAYWMWSSIYRIAHWTLGAVFSYIFTS